MPLVVGVDSSTQSTKVEARDLESGEVVGRMSSPHPPTVPPVSEQDPGVWWDALVEAMSGLGDLRRDVVGMSVAAQQHGLVLLDDAGEPIRPAKLWNDTTSAPQTARLVAEYGAEWWSRRCGSVPVPSFTVTKLAWMVDEEPESLARTAKVMLPHDYLTWRLTGAHVTDRGDASGTGWFDVTAGSYDEVLLGTVVTDPASWIARLPRILAADARAGELTGGAAAALGVPEGTTVGAGTGDNMGAALGLGLRRGDLAMSLGTSGTVYAVSGTPTSDPTGAVAGFADASGGYLPLVCTLNATRVTDAVAAWLGIDAPGLAELAVHAAGAAAGTPVSDAAPVVIPYFDGERTPDLPDATGAIEGLRTTTSRDQLALAAHDGVLCGLFDGIDALAAAGVDTAGPLHLIGGGARSVAYRRRCADLRGEPVVVPDAVEAVATGAAVQAATVIAGVAAAEIAARWRLGRGEVIDPTTGSNGAEVRAAYADARRRREV